MLHPYNFGWEIIYFQTHVLRAHSHKGCCEIPDFTTFLWGSHTCNSRIPAVSNHQGVINIHREDTPLKERLLLYKWVQKMCTWSHKQALHKPTTAINTQEGSHQCAVPGSGNMSTCLTWVWQTRATLGLAKWCFLNCSSTGRCMQRDLYALPCTKITSK